MFRFLARARISAGFCPFSLIFSASDSVFRAEHAVKRLRSTQKSLLPVKNARSEGEQKSETSEKTPNDNVSQVSSSSSKFVHTLIYKKRLLQQRERDFLRDGQAKREMRL